MGKTTQKSIQHGGETAASVAVAYMIAILLVPHLQFPEGVTEITAIGAMTSGIAAIIRFVLHRFISSRNGGVGL